MKERRYLEDLKNLKPLPLDRGMKSEDGNRKSEIRKTTESEAGDRRSEVGKTTETQDRGGRRTDNKAAVIIKDNYSGKIEMKEVIVMESLKNSKTLWGFGIAALIFVLQQVLAVLNIAGPDNLIVKAVIEVVIAVAGFCGVYGIRDALRKMSSGQ